MTIPQLDRARADIWRLALELQDRDALIVALLEVIGVALDADTAAFLTFSDDGKRLAVKLQWRQDGSEEGADTSIPAWLALRIRGRSHFAFSVDDVPAFARLVVEPLMHRLRTKSVVLLPYGHAEEPDGFISVSNFKCKHRFEQQEIDLISELTRLVYLRSAQIEEALARQRLEQDRSLLLHHAPFGVAIHEMVWNAQGDPIDYIFLDVNPAFEELTGLRAIDVVGQRVTDVLPGVESSGFIEKFGAVVRSGDAMDFEQFAPQLKRHYHITVYRVEQDRFATIFSDTTKQVEIQAALRDERDRAQRYLDIAGVMIVALDQQGKVAVINRRGAEILGCPQHEIVGADWFADYVPQPIGEIVRAGFQQMMAGAVEPYAYYENVVVTTSGEQRLVAFHNVLLHDDTGKVIGTLSSGEDITDRKLADTRLQKAMADLETTNAELREFTYVASHDLQEPLRTIASFGHLLSDEYGGALGDEGNKYIRYMREAACRSQSLVRDLLAYSRLSRRTSPHARVDINEIVRSILADFEKSVADAAATIHVSNLPAVHGDAHQVKELFRNIIGNALKYCAERAPEVNISAELKNGDVAFAVRDNGIGLDMKYAERIFGVFQRLHGRFQYEGTGIGLALCRKIVGQHDGRIWVESAPGEGATFRFTLPIAREEHDATSNADPTGGGQPSGRRLGHEGAEEGKPD